MGRLIVRRRSTQSVEDPNRVQTRTMRPGNRDETRADSAECTSAATERGETVAVGRCSAKDWLMSSVGWMTQVDESGGADRTAEAAIEPGQSAVEDAECAQLRKPIGVVGTGKNGASIRVLLTGRETAETTATTKEEQAQSSDNERLDQRSSRGRASYPAGAQGHTARACMSPSNACVRFRTRKAA